ncbi:hypothetical protein TWF225_011210 [Orbilia oligospora]|nr:hypothetical protein TWF225_011210 [Orbilia oligospora]KAF3248215.1 hypothetical protein TWF217_009186 [Orbilia oligospora]
MAVGSHMYEFEAAALERISELSKSRKRGVDYVWYLCRRTAAEPEDTASRFTAPRFRRPPEVRALSNPLLHSSTFSNSCLSESIEDTQYLASASGETP